MSNTEKVTILTVGELRKLVADPNRMRDLIEEYGITSTRTSPYGKEEGFADYIFVSDGITVKDFKVLPDEISDRAPLYLNVA